MLFVGVVLGLVHWLLYRRFAVAPGLGVAARRAVAVGLVLLWIPPFVAAGAGNAFSPQPVRPIVWLGEVWLAVLFYLGIGLMVVGLVLLVARLLKYQDQRRLIRVLSAVVIVAAVGTVAYGVVAANRLRVVEADLTFAQLPRQFDGLRVVVVADIHVGAARGADFTQRVVELVNERQPDVIVLPGDLLDGAVEHVAAATDPGPDVAAALAGQEQGRFTDVSGEVDQRHCRGPQPGRRDADVHHPRYRCVGTAGPGGRTARYLGADAARGLRRPGAAQAGTAVSPSAPATNRWTEASPAASASSSPGRAQPVTVAVSSGPGVTPISATSSAVVGTQTAQEKWDSSAHWAERVVT